MSKTIWEKLSEEELQNTFAFAEEYRNFLNASKTEREFTANAVKLCEEAGFHNLYETDTLNPGDRVYAVNRGKNIAVYVIGKEPLTSGMNVLGAHIDSPRLDIKQNPLYEKDGLALLDTHYYGGIKKYQWTARAMALHGVVCRTNGDVVNVVIGEDESDPVIGISEILIHLSGDQMKKNAASVVEGEDLDILAGSIPMKDEEKDPVKKYVMNLLNEKYGIDEKDFMSAELEVVPAEKARDFGLDRSMILGYGHDDKVCGYTSLRAILDTETPKRTSCCILVDKEEIGSVGNTGMQSRFFVNVLMEMLAKQGYPTLLDINHALENSQMLSSDVNAGFDPLYPGVFDPKNSAYMGKGIGFVKFTGRGGKGGGSDASPEFFAKVRKVMEDNDITYQTCEIGAVDKGGGGTIALYLANLNIEVLDAGIPVLNMHAPQELVSKADVYEAYRAYKAFLKDMD